MADANTGLRSWAVDDWQWGRIAEGLHDASLGMQAGWNADGRLPAVHALHNELAEEACRVHQLRLSEELQAGAHASAATSRGVAGATTAAADLPAQEAQQKQQQHQHQQECGGACDASSSDGAPITPTGQAAALPQQHHGSSDQEQGQWDAAGEEPAPP